MSKELINIQNRYLVLSLSISDFSWPPLWYHQGSHGRLYYLFSFGIETTKKEAWGFGINCLFVSLIFGFPFLLKN